MKPEDLIKWRTERDLFQEDLGSLLGVSKACISRWESGKRKIPAFLHLALKCTNVKKKGEDKPVKGAQKKTERMVKK